MNYLSCAGMFLYTLGSILSPNRRAYNPYAMYQYPQYSSAYYPSYYPTNTQAQQQQRLQQQTQNLNLVGNTLSNLAANTTTQMVSPPTVQQSLINIANTKPQTNMNLVGNTLSSINPNAPSVSTSPYGMMPDIAVASPSSPFSLYSMSNYAQSSPTLFQIANAKNNSYMLNKTAADYSPSAADSNVGKVGKKVKPSPEIIQRVKQIAQKINCDYKDLLGLIFCESSFKTVPDNWNGKSAVGLIQFTDICIRDINKTYNKNYTKQQIAKMTALQQLDVAELALIRAKKVAGFSSSHRLTAGELYAINYAPGFAKRKNYVTRRGDGHYEGNEGLDLNKDGKITHAELASKINNGKLHVIC